MSWPQPIFKDSTPGAASRASLPVLSCPIPGVNVPYLVTEDWVQFLTDHSAFSPTALNTAHPEYTDYLLVGEGPLRDIGGGMVRWTKTFAKLPASHDEPQSFVYNFVGMVTYGPPSGVLTTRTPRTWQVNSMMRHDYFVANGASVVDPILGGSPVAINGPGDIPFIYGMIYCNQATVDGATYGGVSLATTTIYPASFVTPTWPSSEQYQAAIADALTNGWSGTRTVVRVLKTQTLAGGPPPTSGHMAGVIDTGATVLGGILPAEDSRIDRWMGNIFLRQTRYVLAQ